MAFGVTADEEQAANDWIMSHLGSVLGADGRGGSGTFIELADSRLALLTARHVVVRCILTGEMTVLRFRSTSAGAAQSAEPDAIRIDCNKDAAYLLLDPKKFEGDRLPYSSWSRSQKDVSVGMPVIISGVVGEWKAPDVTSRVIPQTKVLCYWTSIANQENDRQLMVCDVDESNSELPRSFKGMSGGSCFSLERTLLGVTVHEIRRRPGTKIGEIQVVPINAIRNLFEPFQLPPGSPVDYMCQKVRGVFWAVREDSSSERVRMSVNAEFFWSLSNPATQYGRFGRLVGLQLNLRGGAERYPINCESVFCYEGSSAQEMTSALQEEISYFLLGTGFRAERDDNPEILDIRELKIH